MFQIYFQLLLLLTWENIRFEVILRHSLPNLNHIFIIIIIRSVNPLDTLLSHEQKKIMRRARK